MMLMMMKKMSKSLRGLKEKQDLLKNPKEIGSLQRYLSLYLGWLVEKSCLMLAVAEILIRMICPEEG